MNMRFGKKFTDGMNPVRVREDLVGQHSTSSTRNENIEISI